MPAWASAIGTERENSGYQRGGATGTSGVRGEIEEEEEEEPNLVEEVGEDSGDEGAHQYFADVEDEWVYGLARLGLY